ncbi:MAG: class I SAM-dependent methyltransferase [Solirubrobacteraceae bacterium]
MAAPSTCAICGGSLELAYPGSSTVADAEALSPTCHRAGEHGDLYRCTRCGTVHQPDLPVGPELYALYRQMRDDHYLDEERGRRRTARRLLDLVAEADGPPVLPDGTRKRLLDVGCGPGLLLDEARQRAYDVRGLELSEASIAHARNTLELPVEQTALTDFADHAGFDVIVLADVIEHLDDVPGGLDRCRELLAPGGTLCVVTPDPASRTARLVGDRWWGYVPAHTFLLPRATLRRLLTERGLAIAADVSLVRTFSLRYWFAGLGERGGPLGAVSDAAQRVLPQSLSLSLSLGDERVVLARKPALVTQSPNGAVPESQARAATT